MSNPDLRGTYTSAISGYVDLSVSFDKNLPAGYTPMVAVEAFSFDGKGNGTGWFTGNFGGIQFEAPVRFTYSVQADCRIQGTESFKINGTWTPGQKVVWVISGTGEHIELRGIVIGGGLGMGVSKATARRISMSY